MKKRTGDRRQKNNESFQSSFYRAFLLGIGLLFLTMIPACRKAEQAPALPAPPSAAPVTESAPFSAVPETILSDFRPPAPPSDLAAVLYAMTGTDSWTVSARGSVKPEVRVESGVTYIDWPGGVGEAVVEGAVEIPIPPAPQEMETPEKEKPARLIYRLNIVSQDHGGAIETQLLSIDSNGKSLEPCVERNIGYAGGHYAKPGDWSVAAVDCPANNSKTKIRGVKPRFVLRGNAIRVAIGQVYLAPAFISPKWDRPDVQSEPREYDEAKVAAILAKRAKAAPRLERRANRVALLVDGKEVYPGTYHRGWWFPKYVRFGDFSRAGFSLFHLPVVLTRTTSHPIQQGIIGPLWLGKDKFDFSRLEEELKIIVNINPDALVILVAGIGPYREWGDENPDYVFANEKGEKGISEGCSSMRYGGKPDYTNWKGECYTPSYFGGKYGEDAAGALRALGRFLETSPVGKIVIGVDLCGGNDSQFFPWGLVNNWHAGDYSPGAIRAWRVFLRQMYDNDPLKLRSAWNDPAADFDSAGVPNEKERGCAFDNTKPPTRRGIDYNEFLNRKMAEFILTLGKAMKDGSNGRLLAGVYYPDCGDRAISGKNALGMILRSPYIDCIRSLARFPLNGSYWWHNKLYLKELDTRNPRVETMRSTAAGYLGYPDEYDADDAYKLFRDEIWRCAVLCLSERGGGYYHYDMAEGWYCDRETIEFFGQVRNRLGPCLSDAVNVEPPLAVFTDEHVSLRLPRSGDFCLCMTTSRGIYDACDRSGIPYRRYLQDDIYEDDFPLPKICIFPLPMGITSEKADLIRAKARKAGSILVWGYAPGKVADGAPSAKDVCGFDAVFPQWPELLFTQLKDKPIIVGTSSNLLARGMEGRILGNPLPIFWGAYRWTGVGGFVRPQPGEVGLGCYAGTNLPGLVWRDKDGLRELFVGFPGAFSPALIRNLARLAGFTPLQENDNCRLFFGNGLLLMISDFGGPQTIHLPQGFCVRSSPTGHAFKATRDGFTFVIGYAEPAVFEIAKSD
ncbi:MAG: hypothetical protein Q7J98_05655 [Kiritimatiellia bacterium]|nr:hypothetical protein [Kiritimatiellia bacterium]